MPAEVTTLSYAKFNDRDIPWWGTGKSARENPVEGRWLTVEEAKATFPWELELRPAYQRRENGAYRTVEDSYHVTLIHDDPSHDDHELVLGTVGKLYTPYQPDDLIEQAVELVDDFGFGFDTVGDLRRHKIIFAALKISEVPGITMTGVVEELEWWLLLSNWNDGSGSLRGDIAPIRTVCMNTLQAAQARTAATWKVRHVGDMVGRTQEGRRALGIITAYEKEYAETAERMAEASFEIEQFQAMAEELMPTDESVGPRTRVFNTDNQTGMMANFLTSGTLNDEWRFTRWGALNAVTEWSEWIYDERKDSRTADKDRKMLFKMYDGPQARLRQRTFDYLTRTR